MVVHAEELLAALGTDHPVVVEKLEWCTAVVARSSLFADVNAHTATVTQGCHTVKLRSDSQPLQQGAQERIILLIGDRTVTKQIVAFPCLVEDEVHEQSVVKTLVSG